MFKELIKDPCRDSDPIDRVGIELRGHPVPKSKVRLLQRELLCVAFQEGRDFRFIDTVTEKLFSSVCDLNDRNFEDKLVVENFVLRF